MEIISHNANDARISSASLSSCARATTREEGNFRVDYPNSQPKTGVIFVLEPVPDSVLETDLLWQIEPKFIRIGTCQPSAQNHQGDQDRSLVDSLGNVINLEQEITKADTIIIVMSTDTEEFAIRMISAECSRQAKTCMAFLLTARGTKAQTAQINPVIRQVASVLVVSQKGDYLGAMIEALRLRQ